MRKLILTATVAAFLTVSRSGVADAQTVIQYTAVPAGPVYTYGYAYPSYGYVSGYPAYRTYSYPVYGYPIQVYPAYAYPAFSGLSVNFGYSPRGHWGGYYGGWGGHSGGYHGGRGGHHR